MPMSCIRLSPDAVRTMQVGKRRGFYKQMDHPDIRMRLSVVRPAAPQVR